MSEDYNFLSDEQWASVLSLLERDLRLHQQGMRFIAPSYPEAGQELRVEFDLELEDMVWSSGQRGRSLSHAILADNDSFCRNGRDEIERIIASLGNTANVLRAALERNASACVD